METVEDLEDKQEKQDLSFPVPVEELTMIDKLEEEAKQKAAKHVAGMLRRQESLDKVSTLYIHMFCRVVIFIFYLAS